MPPKFKIVHGAEPLSRKLENPIFSLKNRFSILYFDKLFFFVVDRYLKSVFPTVEEYLLLDVLSNSDNNVQKGSDRLVKMGYVKRDTPSKYTGCFENYKCTYLLMYLFIVRSLGCRRSL